MSECPVIRQHFWNPTINLLTEVGMRPPEESRSFILLGRITAQKAISKFFSGVMFLAWRCLYAELVDAKINKARPNLKNAYKRMLVMNITRLTAYGEKWTKWVRKNRKTGNKSFIPEKHQNKHVIVSDQNANYTILPTGYWGASLS